ncbi:MAG: dihydrolipoamide acetyltransferase family protein [Planctomycetota bacterium]
MYEFKLPDLGEGIHEGEILKWHVEPGATIEEDAPLVDVETDKAALTIPSPCGGKVVSTSGAIGETVFVGNIIVVIDNGSGPAAEPAKEPMAKPVAAAVGAALSGVNAPAAQSPATSRGGNGSSPPAAAWGRVVAAPATRRLARELDVDIARVPPTGPAGRVTPEDVKRFADGGAPAAQARTEAEGPAEHTPFEFDSSGKAAIPFLMVEPLPDFSQWGPIETEPVRSIRRKVARKMVTSMILVPHVAHMDEADVTLLEEFRRRERDRRAGEPGGRLTLLAFVIKAVTAGLKESPIFNASLDFASEQIVYKKYYNVGVAVDTDRGLVVPVIRDTDRKSILQISADIEHVAAKARNGELEAADLRGGTFTITNVGPLGGTAVVPTINYPEAAILGMARAKEKPVVVDGEIVVRKMLPITLAFDHRIADGAEAARFASGIVRRLSDPNLLMLEA